MRVPDDYLVRKIAAVLDLSWVHAELAPYYPRIGRPSIDPELMIRMLIVGYVFAIELSDRFVGRFRSTWTIDGSVNLGLEDPIPDHSAFSRARNERFRDSGIFRRVFERVVANCIEYGLVGGDPAAQGAALSRGLRSLPKPTTI